MRSEKELLKTHKVRGKVPGWFFRVLERPVSHWEVEGLDARGRRVVVEGSDSRRLLSEAGEEARKIQDARPTT